MMNYSGPGGVSPAPEFAHPQATSPDVITALNDAGEFLPLDLLVERLGDDHDIVPANCERRSMWPTTDAWVPDKGRFLSWMDLAASV